MGAAATIRVVPASAGTSTDQRDDFLTPKEVVARWKGRVTEKTLANWRSMDPGPGPKFKRFGGRILYSLSEIVAYEQKRDYETTKDYGKRK